MARQSIIAVNASSVLTDEEIKSWIAPQQLQLDRDILPHWGSDVVDAELSFLSAAEIPNIPKDAWPIFVNRHSTDPGALGWHADENAIFGRVFAGDCLIYGVSPSVDFSHEFNEMIGDPNTTKTFTLPDGRIAAWELCDPVEDDAQAVIIDGVKLSNWVRREYFSTNTAPGTQYDFGKHLTGPCPTLTAGGYQSLCVNGQWTQLQADRHNGLAGRRALMRGWRRHMRGALPLISAA